MPKGYFTYVVPIRSEQKVKNTKYTHNVKHCTGQQRAHYTINTIKNTTMPAFRFIGAFEPLITNNSRTLSS